MLVDSHFTLVNDATLEHREAVDSLEELGRIEAAAPDQIAAQCSESVALER